MSLNVMPTMNGCVDDSNDILCFVDMTALKSINRFKRSSLCSCPQQTCKYFSKRNLDNLSVELSWDQ